MSAILIKCGDPPPTFGGEYERIVTESLYKKLSHNFLLVANPSFPTKSSYFYDYDIIVISPFLCEIVEIKYIRPFVNVYEDWLESIHSFRIPRIFSILDNKARVLNSKLRESPFNWKKIPRITSRVLIGPDETDIHFLFQKHKQNKKVIKLYEVLKYYNDQEA